MTTNTLSIFTRLDLLQTQMQAAINEQGDASTLQQDTQAFKPVSYAKYQTSKPGQLYGLDFVTELVTQMENIVALYQDTVKEQKTSKKKELNPLSSLDFNADDGIGTFCQIGQHLKD